MDHKQDVTDKAKGISLRLLILAGIFLLALLLFAVIADEMVLENENLLDKAVFDQLKTITNPAMTNFMVAITFFGSSYFLFPAYILLILYFLLLKKNSKLSWNIAAVGITSTLILFSLKAIFHRQRPLDPLVENVNGFSFPSGHSFSSFTFFGLLIYILWQQKM
ncbi:MAG: phosphatase PAP2 family protein, partial [Chitinophagaceae bacterium]